ncbi:hypothetical protein AAFN85_25935 [Mucilaginibacter sp. CAU 1740]|uniref:hypothetical protein n=1 Tax=Mucilaginibacter sp. CAU 1740 TaxID=3140365 RepID=UPI00325C30F3
MDNLNAYFEMDDRDLLLSIGNALDEDSRAAFPAPVGQLLLNAKNYIHSKLGEYQIRVCGNDTVKELATGGFTTELVAAVIGLIESVTIGAAISPVAILLCKRGVLKICDNTWNLDDSK